VIGAAVVVAGTALVFSAGVDQGVPVGSLLAIVAASACASEGAIIVKGFPAVHPAMRSAIGMTVGTVILLALMPLFHESYALPRSGSTWTAQVYLVLIGTVGVFALYLYVLSKWTASAVSYEFVLAPLVAACWLPGFSTNRSPERLPQVRSWWLPGSTWVRSARRAAPAPRSAAHEPKPASHLVRVDAVPAAFDTLHPRCRARIDLRC
jgi:hypothetical protein